MWKKTQASNGKISSVTKVKHKQNKHCHKHRSSQASDEFQDVFVMTLEEAMYLEPRYLCFESNGN
jgi:hypothetical protein